MFVPRHRECSHQYLPGWHGQFLTVVLTLVASLPPPPQHGQGLLLCSGRLLLYLFRDFGWDVQLPGYLLPLVFYLRCHSDGCVRTGQQLKMLQLRLAVCGTLIQKQELATLYFQYTHLQLSHTLTSFYLQVPIKIVSCRFTSVHANERRISRTCYYTCNNNYTQRVLLAYSQSQSQFVYLEDEASRLLTRPQKMAVPTRK